MTSIQGTITEINHAADRIAVQLSNGWFAVCRLFDRRSSPPIGEAVHGRLLEPGASTLTALGSNRTFRALVLAVFPCKAPALELVHT
ncbi:hypothetical protein [Caldimonas tepidiphila]|uniref:hypothetical protein n=1 Tax=Caldimonas tepidiphila TaxID=2315841 RepID=UPI000E5B29E8|nr:hypothetical protein [Caldimonas tepidiphila]